MQRFNNWLAYKTTRAVATMWCAYGFAILSLLGNPAWSPPSLVNFVQWISQNFIQLVFLSILAVGQDLLSKQHDKHSKAHTKALADLHKSVLNAHADKTARK